MQWPEPWEMKMYFRFCSNNGRRCVYIYNIAYMQPYVYYFIVKYTGHLKITTAQYLMTFQYGHVMPNRI